MMGSGEIENESGEISEEALQQLNALLDQGPGEDASEEEVEAFMKKFADTPGGSAMLKSLSQQLADGGGSLLNGIMGQELPPLDGETDWALYQPPQSPLRLVFLIQPVGSKIPFWRRVTLPSDASFYDLHFALQDAFEQVSSEPHRFEWCEGERVEATFLSGKAEVKSGDDYCEYQNQPLDLFSEGANRVFYHQDSEAIPVFLIVMEKVIEPSCLENSGGLLPKCIGGAGPEKGFEASDVKFRSLAKRGASS